MIMPLTINNTKMPKVKKKGKSSTLSAINTANGLMSILTEPFLCTYKIKSNYISLPMYLTLNHIAQCSATYFFHSILYHEHSSLSEHNNNYKHLCGTYLGLKY